MNACRVWGNASAGLVARVLAWPGCRSPRAERTRGAAGEPEPLGGQTKRKIRINSDEEHIASGSCAHRGHSQHVGVRFARKGSLGRRRAVAFLVGWPGQLAHEPSVRPSFGIELRGCPIVSASGSHVVALPHGGASAAWVATVGHGRRRGVVQHRRPHSFERVGHSGRRARLERRAEVTSIDRGNQARRHRAAWRVIRNAVASSHSRVEAWLIRTFGSLGQFAENGRSVSRVTVRVLPPLASLRAARRVIPASLPSRASWFRGLTRRTAQHANGADAPDGPVLSCRHGARLICTVGRTDETKKYGSTRTKNKSHLAASRLGVVRITSASDSRERALSGGGALSSVSSGGRVNSRTRAVGEAKCRHRASGLSDHVGVRLARRGTPARRRVSGMGGNRRARSMPRGYSPLAPAFVRVCRSLGRRARLERRVGVTSIDRGNRWCRHRAAWRLIRNVMASSPDRVGPGLMRTFGSPGRFAANGGSVSRITAGVSPPLVSPRAAWGVARTSPISRAVPQAIAHSTGRPTRKWSRRA